MKGKIDLVKMWVKKAESDLITAKHSLEIKPKPPFNIICFHAQQCAEKYLKAYLTYHEIEFEKTHVLEDLISLSSQIDDSFIELLEFAKKLTPYAVEVRYPLIEEPTEEEAKEAVEMAVKIKEFVSSRLPIGNDEDR